MKKIIIFDLDGTLLYTLGDLHLAVNYALEKNGFPVRKLEEIRAFVGDGFRKLVERALPNNIQLTDVENVLQDFATFYQNNMDVTTAPYDGIISLLDMIKKLGCNIAINSNKHDNAVQVLCKKYFPQSEISIGTREGIPPKPAINGVKDILTFFDSKVGDLVYFVGDSDVDIKTAKNAGIKSIGVTWGYRSIDYLEGADFLANTPEELLEILKR